MNLNTKVLKCLLSLVICTFLLLTCSQEKEKTLDQEKFVQVLSDLMLIENMAVADSTKIRLINDSLIKYSVSLDKIKITIGHFEDNPEYWQKIYTQVKENLKENKIKYN